MKLNICKFAVPAALVMVMVAFLSTFFLVNAAPSFAASEKKKTSAAVRKSAVEQTEERIKALKSALMITEPQEIVWNNLTQGMRENAKEMDALTKDRAELSQTMNAVERMKFHSQVTETQLAHQKRFIPTFEAFYTSLSDEQKKITDSLFRTGKHGKRTIQ